MVDAAANLRGFLTMKSKDGMSAPTKKDDAVAADAPAAATPEAKQGLTLSTAVRDSMMVGLTDALEKLTGLAGAVGEATIDEAAATPPEVGELFKQISDLLITMAGDAAPAAEPAAAPAAAPAAPPPPAPAAKTEDGDADIVKAGRKISGANLKQLKTARDSLSAVIDAAEAEKKATKKSAGTDADDADVDEPDPLTAKIHKMFEQFGTKLDERDATSNEKIAKLALAVHDKNTTIADQKTAVAKAKEQIANLLKRANSPGGGNAGSSEADGAKPVKKGGGESWGAWERRMKDPNNTKAAGR